MKTFKNLLAFCILLFLVPVSATACSCIGKESVKTAVKKANVVFSGKVIKAEEFSVPMGRINFGSQRIKYTFEVQKFYKGNFTTETFEIISYPGGGDCGFQFKIGGKYIVYAYSQTRYYPGGEDVEEYFITDICTRTTSSNQKEKLKLAFAKK